MSVYLLSSEVFWRRYIREQIQKEILSLFIFNFIFILMLCLGLLLLLFMFHASKVKLSERYRKLTTHAKIEECYSLLHTCAWGLHFVFPAHHLRKHLAILSPGSPSMLLWFISPCPGFDLIITCAWLNPYLGVLVACSYPLSILQAIVVIGAFVTLNTP